MSSVALVLATLLACSPLAAEEMVSPEMPVSDLRLVADGSTSCGVASGTTKAYALCAILSGDLYRYDLAADGKPLLYTRTPLAPSGAGWAIAGDALFTARSDATSISVMRFGGDAVARIEAASPSQPRLTWNGGSLLLLTYTSRGTIAGAIVDTSLRTIVRPFPIAPAGTIVTASAGGGFLVVSHEATRTAGTIVDPDGATHVVALPAPIIAFDALASNGAEYYYVWQRDRTPLAAQRYSPKGEAIGGLDVLAQGEDGRLSFPRAAWSGSDYIVTWIDGSASWMRTPGGAVQSLGSGYANIVAGPAGTYVTMSHPNAAQTIRRLDTDGPEQALGYGPSWQTVLAMAGDGAQRAVLWREPGQVRIGRIDSDGTPLDGPGVVVTTDNAIPALAFDGVSYLVVWIKSPHVYGRFFARDGRMAPERIVIADEPRDSQIPAIAWTGTHYLVTWQSTMFSLGTGAIVTTSGSATPFQYGGSGFSPSVSPGPRALVAYADLSESFYTKISAVFLDAAGSPFDVMRELNTGIWSNLSEPRVVSNGRDFLITWIRQSQPPRTEAWVARLDDRGHLTGTPFLVASSDASISAVSIQPLFDGNDYRVAVSGDHAWPLFVARVTDASFACGCLEDRLPVPIDFDIGANGRTIGALATSDTITIAYAHWFEHDMPRVVVRFIRKPPPPRRRSVR